MSWALPFIHQLKNGETIKFRPSGTSMRGIIESKNLCTVEPVTDHAKLEVGDAVLCKVAGKYRLHMISAINGNRFQISNSRGRINGWTTDKQIYGKVTRVER